MQVFLFCKQTWAMHMGGGQALGFTAQEIESACRLAGIPGGELTEIAGQVREMGRIASKALNERKTP